MEAQKMIDSSILKVIIYFKAIILFIEYAEYFNFLHFINKKQSSKLRIIRYYQVSIYDGTRNIKCN